MTHTQDAAIYRAYVEAKADPKRNVGDIIHDFGISRAQLYEVVRRVERGNPSKIRRETERGRLKALWEHKYRTRALALPKDRRAEVVVELRKLIREMHKDGFPRLTIATLLKKDRATVIHHLTK